MRFYQVFGGILGSELEFPELRPTRARAADWTLRCVASCAPDNAGECIGSDVVDANVRVRALRLRDGFRLHFDDTGAFDVSADGREIEWYRPDGVDERAARVDLTGRVLALTLHVTGWLSLHASAVAVDGRALGFLGAKGSGKSTLAVSLARAGAEFMSDDILPVDPRGTPTARPGAPSVRMFPDTASQLGIAIDHATDPAHAKPLFRESALERRRLHPAPLDALYVLAGTDAGDAGIPRRTRLTQSDAVFQVLRHTKIGALLGQSEAATVLQRTAALVSAVPVYELCVPRDFARLDDTATALFEWHSLVAASRITAVAGCA